MLVLKMMFWLTISWMRNVWISLSPMMTVKTCFLLLPYFLLLLDLYLTLPLAVAHPQPPWLLALLPLMVVRYGQIFSLPASHPLHVPSFKISPSIILQRPVPSPLRISNLSLKYGTCVRLVMSLAKARAIGL
jgi:hypothetical protein